jgi:hypothetical protein
MLFFTVFSDAIPDVTLTIGHLFLPRIEGS